ncbi:hypothetical protein [Pedobacter sp. SYSU D00535]|uniref:hypothetical protein n=1 Tax=Pedobacter sp. SYSU D00535 TaxID=2810308 RepID=UPI001A970348|nr:hypothetical protein [Pedobacter sp. SYSU D00535]
MHQHLSENKEKKTFNIYVNLFSNGEFSEMVVTQDANEYQVSLEDTYMGTLSYNDDKSWQLVNGSIPSYLISDITRNIGVS